MSNDKVNWEQARIDAAISAMQGILSRIPNAILNDISRWAVEYADALIAELKKKGE